MKSQAFSMDIMIAFVIFIGTIFVFYSIISDRFTSKTDDLGDEASIVLGNLASEDSEIGIIDGIIVNETKLENLLEMDYSEIKKKIRIKNEFCFFLEDSNGDVIYIKDELGIGSDKINISKVPCA